MKTKDFILIVCLLNLIALIFIGDNILFKNNHRADKKIKQLELELIKKDEEILLLLKKYNRLQVKYINLLN